MWPLLIAMAMTVAGGLLDKLFIDQFIALGPNRSPDALTLLLAQMGVVGATAVLVSCFLSLFDERAGKCTACAAALLVLLAAGLTCCAAGG